MARRNDKASRDATNWEEEEAAEARAMEVHALRMRTEDEILKKVISTQEGRRVLYNIVAKGDIYDLQGSVPYGDAGERTLGRREVAVEVLKDCLRVDPHAYILMQQEAEKFEEEFRVKIGEDND